MEGGTGSARGCERVWGERGKVGVGDSREGDCPSNEIAFKLT